MLQERFAGKESDPSLSISFSNGWRDSKYGAARVGWQSNKLAFMALNNHAAKG
jgi:hypothetical protein